MARSPETPDDDDSLDVDDAAGEPGGDDEEGGEFGGVNIDTDFGRDGEGDDGTGDDPFAGGGPGDDDDFEDFDMGAFGDDDDNADDDGDEGGIPRALIGLIAASLVLIVLIASVVGWLMISADPEADEKAKGSSQVIAALGPLQAEPPKAKPKQAQPEKAKPEHDAAKPADPDPAAKPAEGDAAAKPAAGVADAKPAAGDTAKKDSAGEAGAKTPAGKLVINKTIKEEKVEVAAIDPLLIDETTSGPLPKIAPDGRQAWQVYARPFKAPEGKSAKIAIVMAGLGLSKTQTLAAIQQLPGSITLSFAPYARDLGDWIAQSRAAGHEVLLELPMEPFDYPENDPGPHTLLTKLSTPDNIERLNWLLGRFQGYVGVTNFMGAKFTSNEQKLLPILQSLKDRGLLYLESKADRKSVAARVAKELKVPIVVNNRFIDREASRVSIDARLYELERISKSVGSAVGLAFPYPVTVERLSAWIATLEKKGFVLAPLSAIANSQPIR